VRKKRSGKEEKKGKVRNKREKEKEENNCRM